MLLATTTSGHPLWHFAVVAVLAVAVYGGMVLREHARQLRTSGSPSPHVVIMSVASVGAAALHAAVCPEHFREATVFGVFFAASAVLQAVWAVVVIRRPHRSALAVGAAGNSAVVALWLLSRTSGLPIGPQAWRPERVGSADLTATLLEIVIIAIALIHSHRRIGASPAAYLSVHDRMSSR